MTELRTVQNGIANLLRSSPAIMGLLPGGVWTRRIRKNDGPADAPTPGSTPGAFDAAGRILRCAAVLNGIATDNPTGPAGAYVAYPEIWLRCLPHESEQERLEEAALHILDLLRDGSRIRVTGGGVAFLRNAARMMPDDDPDLPPAVVDMIRVQADGIWRIS